MSHRLLNRPYLHAFATPLERLSELSIWGRVNALLASLFTAMVADITTAIGALLLFAMFYDYRLGRTIAKKHGLYDPLLAWAGMNTKMAGVVIVVIVRVLEWWGERFGIPILSLTDGALAAALIIGLLKVEVDSIEHHRIFLKAKPIPGLHHLMLLFGWISDRLMPPVPSSPPEQKRDP